MQRTVPATFWIVAILGLLWNLYGLAMFWINLTITPDLLTPLLARFAARPGRTDA